MSAFERFLESVGALIRRVIRDVLCPAGGLYLVYKLGLGEFATGAIPFVATLASTLIGLPVWLKSDERRRVQNEDEDEARNGGPRRRGRRRITIDFGGRGEDEEDS